MKIFISLPHQWYVEAYFEYVIRYLTEYQIDMAIATDYERKYFPDKYTYPTQSIMRDPSGYDLIISTLTSHQHLNIEKFKGKLIACVWEQGEVMPEATLHASMTDITDKLLKEADIPFKPVRLGIDTELFQPNKLKIGSDNLQVGVVGRLHSIRKQIKDVVMPLTNIPGVDFRFYTAQLLQQQDILDCGGAEFFTRLEGGNKKWTGMPNIYNQIDVLLETDSGRSLPLAVLEAGACGVPSIMASSGLNSFVEKTGIIIPFPKTGDFFSNSDKMKQDIREAIIYMRDNKEERLKMGERARLEIIDKFSWEKVIPMWRDLIETYARK